MGGDGYYFESWLEFSWLFIITKLEEIGLCFMKTFWLLFCPYYRDVVDSLIVGKNFIWLIPLGKVLEKKINLICTINW